MNPYSTGQMHMASATHMAQMPSGRPRFSGLNQGAMAEAPATPMTPMPAPSNTRLAMKTVTSVVIAPMIEPMIAQAMATITTLRMPNLLMSPVVGNAMTKPST